LPRQDDQKKELTRRLVERHSAETGEAADAFVRLRAKYEDGLNQALVEVQELAADRNGYYERFYKTFLNFKKRILMKYKFKN
jgi:hypothetical protein